MQPTRAKRLRVNPAKCLRCPPDVAGAVHAKGLCFRCYQRDRRDSLPAVARCECGESDVRALSKHGACWNCVAKAS